MSGARLVLLAALAICSSHAVQAQIEIRNSLVDWDGSATQQPVNGWRFYSYRAHDPRSPASFQPMVHFADQGARGWRSSADPLCAFTETQLGILQSPSNELEPVRAWVASANGTVAISPAELIGRPIGNVEGDGVRLQVWRNAWRALDVEIPANEPVNADFTTSFAVDAGDVLYFHCTRNRAPFLDGMRFNPQIVLHPGPGYDPSPRQAGTASTFGGVGSWTAEGFDHARQRYEPMVSGPNNIDNHGPYCELQSYPGLFCRVWRDIVHPLRGFDTVWTYTAPDDGQLLLRSVVPIAKLYADANPVDVELFLRPAGTSARIPVRRVAAIDRSGRSLGKSIHLRRGDRLSVHIADAGATNLNLFSRVSLSAVLHPRGVLRTGTQMPSSWIVQGGPVQHRFHESITVHGDLEVASGAGLELDDCVVLLDNSRELEFGYRWDGRVVTRGSVLGGNRVPAQNDQVLHSNFFVRGRWESTDTEVRYTYGQLLGGTAQFVATGHVSVAHGDFVHIGDHATVDIRDSVVAIAFELPVDRIAGHVDLDLRVDRYDTTLPQIPWQGAPNWTGTIENTMVYWWAVMVCGLHGPATGQSVPYELRFVETAPTRVGVRLLGVRGGSGTLPMPDAIMGIAPGTTWQMFNSRWRAAGPLRTYLQSLSADFAASSAVRLVGPGASHELMAFDWSTVNLIGSPGQHDARSNATRIQAQGNGTRMVLDNCALGTAWTVGEVRAAVNATISIRDARIDHPLSLFAADASNAKIIISRWSGLGSLQPSGRVFEVQDHFSFDDNADGWMNWDPAPRGFVNMVVDRPAPGAAAPPNARVFHLDYPARSAYGTTLAARIVAPGSLAGTILTTAGDLYLYARIRAQVATPRLVAGQPVVRMQYTTRDPGVGWSSWGNYYRTMEILADGQFHDYCWKLTAPAQSPSPVLSHGRDPQGGTSLPQQSDYWALHFNSPADLGWIDGARGDFVEVDFVTVADRYDPRLRNW